VLAAVFLWPLGASVVASFSREGQWTLANYDTVRRLYAGDVLYTVGVAAAGTAMTFAVAIPVCGWLRMRAWGPIELLLKVPLFVPFVVVGHALRVFWSPYLPGFSSSWAGIAMALAWKHLGLAALLLPRTAPRVKRNAVEEYGGRVIECEPNLAARETTTSPWAGTTIY